MVGAGSTMNQRAPITPARRARAPADRGRWRRGFDSGSIVVPTSAVSTRRRVRSSMPARGIAGLLALVNDERHPLAPLFGASLRRMVRNDALPPPCLEATGSPIECPTTSVW